MATKRVRSLSLDMIADNNAADNGVSAEAPSKKLARKGRKRNPGKISLSQPTDLLMDSTVNATDASNTLSCNVFTAPSNQCVLCQSVGDVTSVIQCDTCTHLYHLECCQISTNDFAVIRTVIGLLGWTCRACRFDTAKEIRKLRDDLADLQSKLTIVTLSHNETPSVVSQALPSLDNTGSYPPLSVESATVQTSVTGIIKNNDRNVSYAEVVTIVNKSVRDVNLRKRNVIVTGLKEWEDWSDEDIFAQLCEDHLNMKPRLSYKGTRRLGGENSSKPRRLLVHLESEAAAAEVLQYARYLRGSNDEYVSRNIYINADLSKDEAKRAFDRRQERRRSEAVGETNGGQSSHAMRPGRRVTNRVNTFYNSTRNNTTRAPTRNHANLIDCKTLPAQSGNTNNISSSSATLSMSNSNGAPIIQSTSSTNVLNPSATSYEPKNSASSNNTTTATNQVNESLLD